MGLSMYDDQDDNPLTFEEFRRICEHRDGALCLYSDIKKPTACVAGDCPNYPPEEMTEDELDDKHSDQRDNAMGAKI